MLRRLIVSVLLGVVTFFAVYKIARIEPLVYGLIFGVINAAVVFAVYSMAMKPAQPE